MLVFSTPEPLDIHTALIMGLSAKSKPDAIGKFGTGLNFAIAGVLRLGGTLMVETEYEGEPVSYYFSAETSASRGKTFEQVQYAQVGSDLTVHCNFTTSLGAHWTPEMIYRELWANTKDEGGVVWTEGDEWIFIPGQKTHIYVDCPVLEAIHSNPKDIILTSPGAPLWDSPDMTIYQGGSNKIFYKGLAVCHSPTALTYNIKTPDAPLTEDRTIDSGWCKDAIVRALIQLSGPQAEPILSAVLLTYNGDEPYWFTTMNVSEEPSDDFLAFVKANRLNRRMNEYVLDFCRDFIPGIKDYPEAQIDQEALQRFEALYSKICTNITMLQPEAADALPKVEEVKIVNFKSTYQAFDYKIGTLYISAKVLDQPTFPQELLFKLMVNYANTEKALAQLMLPKDLQPEALSSAATFAL